METFWPTSVVQTQSRLDKVDIPINEYRPWFSHIQHCSITGYGVLEYNEENYEELPIFDVPIPPAVDDDMTKLTTMKLMMMKLTMMLLMMMMTKLTMMMIVFSTEP
jgi:hypothetical protein